jgi:hypothetical protein
MHKIPRCELKRPPQTSLNLDQFTDIVRLFKDTCKSVEVTIDRFRLEDCSEAEILELRGHLRASKVYSLEIHGAGPDVALYLDGESRNKMFVHDADDAASTGLAQQVMKKLPPRRLVNLVRLAGFPVAMAILFCAISLMDTSWSMRGGLDTLRNIARTAMAIAALSLLLYFRRVPVLSLEKQSERRPFLETHKHDLLKGAILLFLGSILTLAVQLILKSVK